MLNLGGLKGTGQIWPIGGEMEGDKSRYFDFSEDDQLLAQFEPSDVPDWYLKWAGELIQDYLRLRNPASRIAGLIAHHSAISTGIAIGIQSSLTWIKWLLITIVILLGYIVVA